MDTDFHFHEWAFLAQADADAFERRRKDLIESFLRRTGKHRHLLEPLQREIDQLRAQAASPDEAVIAISGMMCNSFHTLINELSGLRGELLRLRTAATPLGEGRPAELPASATPDRSPAQVNCILTSR